MLSSDFSVVPILERWVAGSLPTKAQCDRLAEWELTDPRRARAFGLHAANVREQVHTRARHFQAIAPEILPYCCQLGLTQRDANLLTLWGLWLPLALQMSQARQQLQRPLVQGILGAQGTGKTTLASICRRILEHLGYPTLSLSIDDLYKTYEDRQRLQAVDPRLVWRGPPGTHEVKLGIELFDQVRQGHVPLIVPRFDKSAYEGAGDRAPSEIVETRIEIVLFEGWFVGVRPVAESAFVDPPPPIHTDEDRRFALDCNRRLHDYLPLWERLDRLLVLAPIDYRLSKQWRREAEQRMVASGKSGMSDFQIDQFVEYFWRSLHPELFITPLLGDAKLVSVAIEIKADRTLKAIYQPSRN